MAIRPVVRYMLLCDDWRLDAADGSRVRIIDLVSQIVGIDDPPYPLRYEELCVFLVLTEGSGQGQARIVCIHEDSGRAVFETPSREIQFGADPLSLIGVPYRIRDCLFPEAGMYSVQFWYEGQFIEERPLRLR